MEPIINPWMIYLIGNINNFSFFCVMFGVVSLFFAIMFWCLGDGENEPLIFKNKPLKWFLSVASILLILTSVLTPNSKTLTAMVIANEVTYDRVDSLKDTVGDIHNIVKQDIIDMIQEIKRDEVKTEVK